MTYLDTTAGNRAVSGVVAVAGLLVMTGHTAAGVYTTSVPVPAGASILDIIIDGIAYWDSGTSATGIVGDVVDDNGYFTGIDLKATDLVPGESLSFSMAGGKVGAYIANSQVSPRYSALARTITLKCTTVGVTGTGSTRLTVIYAMVGASSTVGTTYVAT